MRRYKLQGVFPHFPLSCFQWNTVLRLLYILCANTCVTDAFRIQLVESAAGCQDHTVHFIPTFAVTGEPVVLKCPPFRYGLTDPLDRSLNLTWCKNGSTTLIPSEQEGARIWSQGDALWFLPASLEDSGEYICTQRNSSYCADVSLHLIIVEKSAARNISYPQKAFIQSSGHVVCPALENFVEKDTDYQLRWYKDSTLLNIDNKKFVALSGTEYLIINSVSLDDSGYYTCQLIFDHETGQYNVTRTIELQTFVQKKKNRPVIVSPNQNILPAVLDSRLTIPCKVFVGTRDRTYADVWWLANQTHVQRIYKRGRVTEGEPQKFVENDDNYIEVPLIFDPVKEVDFYTDFTCVAWNSLGHQMQETQVKPEAENPLSWHLAIIPVALAVVVVGAVRLHKCWRNRSSKGLGTVMANLGTPAVLGLQFPEALINRYADLDFWELKPKNSWSVNVGQQNSKDYDSYWERYSPLSFTYL